MQMEIPGKYLEAYRKAMGKFINLTDEQWDLMSPCLRLEKLKKKATWIEAGEVCKTVGYIISGSVRLYHMKDGEEITSYFCMEDEWVSSYTSFLKQRPSLNYIEALEDTMILTFTYQQLQQWQAMPQLSHVVDRFCRLIAEYLICCYEDRVASFILQSPEERYMQLLENGRNILQRIPQHYIANYLGITPVSLSRIRKRILQTV
ncbi:Crp/Fnr family transcriptional regulator [Mucilaginibacter sp. Bleaf8]|nr:Crp/Fnr family transcriptional regulator [Mucilaginibacter sp. Bleaf8]